MKRVKRSTLVVIGIVGLAGLVPVLIVNQIQGQPLPPVINFALSPIPFAFLAVGALIVRQGFTMWEHVGEPNYEPDYVLGAMILIVGMVFTGAGSFGMLLIFGGAS
ncbi:hypothetical protein NTE_01622 [Candidatus Nitrososphaera evergladensis SR1]|uniref:Uncharacterized protein n=1 Tax=Candidatus Nitrososphaera evergladensis SR1 TaxID=1459636 RepID=A0A075MWP2_9ARCH|nr:hypothetical protein [Candidatus Nitrososphaera evergladensis]AIF83684.1 hypothetical protein NTE_01622 [Candidatus Nitrososphaera evergladensis SR1]